MKRGVFLAIMALLVTVVGVLSFQSSNTVPVSDATAAGELLQRTLEDFRAQRSVGELRQQQPPVYVSDELWLSPFQLKNYNIEGPGEMYGTNVRFRVTLEGVDPTGKKVTHQVKYLVTTTPALTIAKEDR